jgi:hypothetical protein
MMIDRDLIAKVVAEVLKQLSALEAVVAAEAAKPNLLVFGSLERLTVFLKETMNTDWNLIGGESWTDIQRYSPKKVLFLEASQDLLVKGATGLTDSAESEVLAACIWANIPVSLIPTEFLSAYLLAERSTNQAYFLQMKEYVERLERFGVSVETLEKAFQKESITSQPSQAPKVASGKKLLTQREVQSHQGKLISVDASTIITPLARDSARELGITIELMK